MFSVKKIEKGIQDTFDNKTHRFEGICYRAVWNDYANRNSLVSSVGSFITGGRYNGQGNFGVLYLACDPKTCIEELVHSIENSPKEMAKGLPRIMVSLKVKVSKVLKLNREHILDGVSVKKLQLVNSKWDEIQLRDTKESKTQIIGRIAREVGFEAILVPSARRDGCNLNLFLDNLHSDSEVQIFNVKRLNEVKKSYEDFCKESLQNVEDGKSGRSLTDNEKKSLFCPVNNLIF